MHSNNRKMIIRTAYNDLKEYYPKLNYSNFERNYVSIINKVIKNALKNNHFAKLNDACTSMNRLVVNANFSNFLIICAKDNYDGSYKIILNHSKTVSINCIKQLMSLNNDVYFKAAFRKLKNNKINLLSSENNIEHLYEYLFAQKNIPNYIGRNLLVYILLNKKYSDIVFKDIINHKNPDSLFKFKAHTTNTFLNIQTQLESYKNESPPALFNNLELFTLYGLLQQKEFLAAQSILDNINFRHLGSGAKLKNIITVLIHQDDLDAIKQVETISPLISFSQIEQFLFLTNSETLHTPSPKVFEYLLDKVKNTLDIHSMRYYIASAAVFHGVLSFFKGNLYNNQNLENIDIYFDMALKLGRINIVDYFIQHFNDYFKNCTVQRYTKYEQYSNNVIKYLYTKHPKFVTLMFVHSLNYIHENSIYHRALFSYLLTKKICENKYEINAVFYNNIPTYSRLILNHKKAKLIKELFDKQKEYELSFYIYVMFLNTHLPSEITNLCISFLSNNENLSENFINKAAYILPGYKLKKIDFKNKNTFKVEYKITPPLKPK